MTITSQPQRFGAILFLATVLLSPVLCDVGMAFAP